MKRPLTKRYCAAPFLRAESGLPTKPLIFTSVVSTCTGRSCSLSFLPKMFTMRCRELPAGSCISGITETIQRKLLDRVNKQLDDVFTSITLKDLADDYIQNQMEAADMYYI